MSLTRLKACRSYQGMADDRLAVRVLHPALQEPRHSAGRDEGVPLAIAQRKHSLQVLV